MQQTAYKFDRFELLPMSRVLRLDGNEVAVAPRAFDLLVALVERAGRLVSKNELLDLVWSNLVVEENNLQVQVSALRKILGLGAIATVPGRGYMFTLLPGPVDTTTTPSPTCGEAVAMRVPGNLPAVLPPLYGRNDAVVTLAQMLERRRIVSVVGPGGIGKTRVALAVAHAVRSKYADGAWLVELAPVADRRLVAPTAARVLGHAVAPRETALDALVEAVRDREMLLLFDNCEHLLEAVIELASRIAAAAPGVRLLITSQEPLHIPEEQVDRLAPLAVPPTTDMVSALSYGAVELFVERARAADPRFALGSDNVDAVVDVCARLDGIALAIELAAARVPLLGIQRLRRGLDERLKLLAGGARTALRRHQTLRAALDWSFALLSVEEQTVFERLGVFVGSFSLEAAQRVARDDSIDAWAVLDHLAALVDKSLVLVESGDVPRYRLLESSRAFALERLATAGATEAMRRLHAQAIADTLTGVDMTEGPKARMRRIGPDLDNVRAAAAWATGPACDRQIAIALAGATDMLWDARGCNDEGDRLYRTVEPWLDASIPPRLAAHFWFAVSNLRLLVALRRQAHAGLTAARLFRDLGDRYWLFRALASAAHKFSLLENRTAAEEALEEMALLLDPSWPSWLRGCMEHGLGAFEFYAARNPQQARRHAESAIALHRSAGEDDYFADASEHLLLFVDYALGDFEAVIERSACILDRSRTSIGATRFGAFVLVARGAALTAAGNLEQAEASLRAAVLRIRHAAGSAIPAFNYVAFLVGRRGRVEDAARLIGFLDGSRVGESNVQSPSQRRAYEAALDIVARALPPGELDRLRAEGGGLSETGATALAFSTKT